MRPVIAQAREQRKVAQRVVGAREGCTVPDEVVLPVFLVAGGGHAGISVTRARLVLRRVERDRGADEVPADTRPEHALAVARECLKQARAGVEVGLLERDVVVDAAAGRRDGERAPPAGDLGHGPTRIRVDPPDGPGGRCCGTIAPYQGAAEGAVVRKPGKHLGHQGRFGRATILHGRGHRDACAAVLRVTRGTEGPVPAAVKVLVGSHRHLVADLRSAQTQRSVANGLKILVADFRNRLGPDEAFGFCKGPEALTGAGWVLGAVLGLRRCHAREQQGTQNGAAGPRQHRNLPLWLVTSRASTILEAQMLSSHAAPGKRIANIHHER